MTGQQWADLLIGCMVALILVLLVGALVVDAGQRWHHTARPRHEHEWESFGIPTDAADEPMWGLRQQQCQTCQAPRIVDLDGKPVLW